MPVQVVQDWLNEFERVQLMLRLSPRLRSYRAQEHGRTIRLEVGEGAESEDAETVGRHVLLELIATRLGRQLEPVGVALAEPRELIHDLGTHRRLTRGQVGVATERQLLHVRQSIEQPRVDSHNGVWKIDERAPSRSKLTQAD